MTRAEPLTCSPDARSAGADTRTPVSRTIVATVTGAVGGSGRTTTIPVSRLALVEARGSLGQAPVGTVTGATGLRLSDSAAPVAIGAARRTPGRATRLTRRRRDGLCARVSWIVCGASALDRAEADATTASATSKIATPIDWPCSTIRMCASSPSSSRRQGYSPGVLRSQRRRRRSAAILVAAFRNESRLRPARRSRSRLPSVIMFCSAASRRPLRGARRPSGAVRRSEAALQQRIRTNADL